MRWAAYRFDQTIDLFEQWMTDRSQAWFLKMAA
jgi:hypothetical protein